MTVFGLDVYYYYFYFFKYIVIMAGDFSCCLRVVLLRVFTCAGQVKELWTSLWSFMLLYLLPFFLVSRICRGDFMVIAYEWWLGGIIHCLEEADHRLDCFVSLVAVSHMLKMIMIIKRVSVLNSHLFLCRFLACILVLEWGRSLWNRKKDTFFLFFFFLKMNNAPFASCNVMYI